MAMTTRTRDPWLRATLLFLLLPATTACQGFGGRQQLAERMQLAERVKAADTLQLGEDIRLVGARIEKLTVDVKASLADLEQRAGRDINEPWTARILAVGAQVVPTVSFGFLCYLVAHRSRTMRAMFDGLKGKPKPI